MLNQDDFNKIQDLANDKYKSKEWTYEKTPKFKIDIETENMNIKGEIKKWKISSLNLTNENEDIDLEKVAGCQFFESSLESEVSKHYSEYIQIVKDIF